MLTSLRNSTALNRKNYNCNNSKTNFTGCRVKITGGPVSDTQKKVFNQAIYQLEDLAEEKKVNLLFKIDNNNIVCEAKPYESVKTCIACTKKVLNKISRKLIGRHIFNYEKTIDILKEYTLSATAKIENDNTSLDFTIAAEKAIEILNNNIKTFQEKVIWKNKPAPKQ